MLQEQVEEIQDERSKQILERAHELKRENDMLKRTLAQIQVTNIEQVESDMDSQDEEYLRLQYFEALRRAEMQRELEHQYYQHLQQAKQIPNLDHDEARLGGINGSDFQTPEHQDYFHYFVYGTEKQTASAHYRPGKSDTNLRKPPINKSIKNQSSSKQASNSSQPLKRKKSSEKESSVKLMPPEQDSFKISPIYSDNTKSSKKIVKVPGVPVHHTITNDKSSNFSLSGSEERDFNYLGTEEKDSEDKQRKKVNQESKISADKVEVAVNNQNNSDIEEVFDAKSDQKSKSNEEEFHYEQEPEREEVQSQEHLPFKKVIFSTQQEFRPLNSYSYVHQALRVKHKTEQEQLKEEPPRPASRYQGDKQPKTRYSVDKSPVNHNSIDKSQVFRQSGDLSTPKKNSQLQKISPSKLTSKKENFSSIKNVVEYNDHFITLKREIIEGIDRKISQRQGENASLSPTKKSVKPIYSPSRPTFNPLTEQYLDFTIKLNIYKPDQTNLNQSPEGKRRRKLLEEFERDGQGHTGFGRRNVEDYASKIAEEKFFNQQRERNKIKLF